MTEREKELREVLDAVAPRNVLKCGECFSNVWRDQYETPWGVRIGQCIFRTTATPASHRCDIPPICLQQMQHAIQQIIAMREAEERAV